MARCFRKTSSENFGMLNSLVGVTPSAAEPVLRSSSEDPGCSQPWLGRSLDAEGTSMLPELSCCTSPFYINSERIVAAFRLFSPSCSI